MWLLMWPGLWVIAHGIWVAGVRVGVVWASCRCLGSSWGLRAGDGLAWFLFGAARSHEAGAGAAAGVSLVLVDDAGGLMYTWSMVWMAVSNV